MTFGSSISSPYLHPASGRLPRPLLSGVHLCFSFPSVMLPADYGFSPVYPRVVVTLIIILPSIVHENIR